MSRHPFPVYRFVGFTFAVSLLAAISGAQERVSLPLLTKSVDPNAFGTQDFTFTTISATSFLPYSNDVGFGVPAYFTSPGLGRYCQPNVGIHYYAPLQVPAGSVIDFVGLNTTTNTDAVYGIALFSRDKFANKSLLVGYSVPAHGWDTDYAGPLGIAVPTNKDVEYVIDVEQAPSADYQYFGWVEVWWRRTVSPAPPAASFTDVPTGHPFFQFIEALKASGITGGCGADTYCPDNPVTRGQMAVFLSKALGLHWPN
jgi:S-layer homology domain